jgi:HAE1 family hydrophobic/amphiphilic exporter-1
VVSRYVLTMGVFIAIVLVGFTATFGLGVNLLPTLTIPIVGVTTTYPGGAPGDLDRQVTRPIEDAVATIPGVTNIQSTSSAGVSVVVINFRPGSNQDSALAEVNQRLADVRGSLPSGVDAPVGQKFDPNASSVLSVAVAGPGGLSEVREWANRVAKPALEASPGVAAVGLFGAPERRIEIVLEPSRLAAFNLSAAGVAQTLQANNLDLPAGELREGDRQVTFSLRTTPRSLQELSELRVAPGVRLSDVGAVRDTEAREGSLRRLNGQPVVTLDVRKLSDANTVSVSQAARAVVQNLDLPSGYTATVINDNGPYIAATVSDTVKEGVLVAVAVAIICLLALGKINTSFAVILAIPISLAAAPIVLQAIGGSFNIISLIALIVAMGIVVDDSIVIAENVDRYRKMGYTPVESVLKGASEIFSAVSAATWSLLAVLLPISFLPGIIGQVFREFGLTLAAAIFLSWLESIFFLTVRMAYTPDPANPTWAQAGRAVLGVRSSFAWTLGVLRKPVGWVAVAGVGALGWFALGAWGALLVLASPMVFFVLRHLLVALLAGLGALVQSAHHATLEVLEWLRVRYERSLRAALKRAWIVLTVTGVFLVSITLVNVPFEFNPRSDDGLSQVEIVLPAGTPLETSNAYARRLEGFFARAPEVKNASAQINTGSVVVGLELTPRGERQNVFDLNARWQTEIAALFADRPELEVRVASGAGTQLALSAPSLEALQARQPAILRAVRADPAVLSVKSSLTDTAPERVFVPDPTRVERTGLTSSDLAQTLRGALEGTRAGDFRDAGDRTVPVFVRLEPSSDAQALLQLPVYAPSLNANLTLGQLGRFDLTQSPTTLTRIDRRYAATLTVTLRRDANALEFQTRTEERLRTQSLLAGGITLGSSDPNSEAALAGDLTRLAPLAVALALVLNYLVLGAQFNSFRYPIYLLAPVPLAIVGALWTLQLFGAGLDVISVLGMVILVGLSTKNAILLLDFVVERTKTLSLRDALVEAGGLRLRPIVMTTLTALVISVPLVIGLGEGAELRRGLGVIILGGLLTGTVLTLYVVPALFYVFERKRLATPSVPSGVTGHTPEGAAL